MWNAITKIFAKNTNKSNNISAVELPGEIMDRGERKICTEIDDFTTKQAKQRASIKWLLSKAFNNKVPENIKEPFYKDQEYQEYLKPQIAGALANAEIYCRTLANIYSDPNYHNLNHGAILQTLARKNTFLQEPSDGSQLTETTLIQTNPLRMSAHMAVIESIMLLYAREVITEDRVIAAVQRFNSSSALRAPSSHEHGALLWIQHACDALKDRIQQENNDDASKNKGDGDRIKIPSFPICHNLRDLCDGVGLAALVSYYCPDELNWIEISVSSVPSVQDSINNLRLVRDFCIRCLPSASIFHLQPEDITYLRDSMKLNLTVLLADLFNIMEIHPISCVREKFNSEEFPVRNAHGVIHKRNLLQPIMAPIPNLRSDLDDPNTAFQQVSKTPLHHLTLKKTNSLQQSQTTLASEFSVDSLIRPGSEESFIVHKGRNIPTLRSVLTAEEPNLTSSSARIKANKEKQNNDSKADERGDIAAGRPSNWEENRKSTFAGRRSRRNSSTDDSQLTIENFGGSQDNLNFIGRIPDKELTPHIGRKISAPSFPVPIENAPVRSTLQDARGSFQLGYDDNTSSCEEKQDDGSEKKSRMKRQIISDDITLNKKFDNHQNLVKELVSGGGGGDLMGNKMSFTNLAKNKQVLDDNNKGIHLVYMNDREELPMKSSSILNKLSNTNGNVTEKKTTFAAFPNPNQTTWQQQVSNVHQAQEEADGAQNSGSSNILNSQLSDVRLKLEEKRRNIESEKRRMEMALNKQRQKVGKAAFLQAVSKGKDNFLKTSINDENEKSPSPSSSTSAPKLQRPFTLQEITDDSSSMEKKWLDDNAPFFETRKTPDLENMDLEQYHQSLAQMNSSLSGIQTDIQRLAAQQNQMQTQQQQKLIAEQQRQILELQQQQKQLQIIQQQIPNPLQTSTSVPHIPPPLESTFFLHNASQVPIVVNPTPPRRTWSQSVQQPQLLESNKGLRTWSNNKPQLVQETIPNSGSFILHHQSDRFHELPSRSQEINHHFQNGGGGGLDRSSSSPSALLLLNHSNSFTTLSQRHQEQMQQQQNNFNNTPSTSPQHRNNVHRQISQLLDDASGSSTKRLQNSSSVNLQCMDGGSSRDTERKLSVTHAPVAAPPVDDMAPQNISFIDNNEDVALSESLSKLNITSGSRTYRIPSPTRSSLISRGSLFKSTSSSSSPPLINNDETPNPQVSSLDGDPNSAEKGFYISFDDELPKRAKPLVLRSKKNSPKKERSYVDDVDVETSHRFEKKKHLGKELNEERLRKAETERREFLIQQQKDRIRAECEANEERQRVAAASALVIGEQNETDPNKADERERKKERIMMLSLHRRQQQEEAKAKKEAETQRRREIEDQKQEEKSRRKEEQIARRAAILEQYKMKKAIEESEREGKTLDKQDMMSLKSTPRLRAKGPTRPRPKTIHIDSGSVQLAEGMSGSRGRKGSTSNLNAYTPSTLKRDYYRGSQDGLADRTSMNNTLLYKDSPDNSRGMSPCHSDNNNQQNSNLGRRSNSYKTSRGSSSTDQDSLAYRFGDTDSGLGRATPPRRAPSPGMGNLRHLPSPSGPGSLPGLMSKGRRVFDDGSSDISSTPSSMMDYTGPRLYKQPSSKSNRSIMLNAVEYCVFPGVVNRDAKRRVLEEINRSESKHFLILFRDAGCQFRALYSYCPDSEIVAKLYGTGPKQVNDKMFDKFFKYNSGGKCFSQIHTKHLTVTIDAFTIHNSLWQGKKVNLPNKKDLALVI